MYFSCYFFFGCSTTCEPGNALVNWSSAEGIAALGASTISLRSTSSTISVSCTFVRALYSAVVPQSCTDTTLTLAAPNDMHMKKAQEHIPVVVAQLEAVTARTLAIEFVVDKDNTSPTGRNARTKGFRPVSTSPHLATTCESVAGSLGFFA